MTKLDFTPLNNFMIAEGPRGELYVFMEAKDKDLESPHIIYDGKDHAVLFMNEADGVILDDIHPDIRKKLANSREVRIVETILEDVRHTYFADLKLVKQLDFDFTKLS